MRRFVVALTLSLPLLFGAHAHASDQTNPAPLAEGQPHPHTTRSAVTAALAGISAGAAYYIGYARGESNQKENP